MILKQKCCSSAVLELMYRLQRFEKTNEKLTRFNELSGTKLVTAMAQFKKHTQLIVEARKDLYSIFRRIRLVGLGRALMETES